MPAFPPATAPRARIGARVRSRRRLPRYPNAANSAITRTTSASPVMNPDASGVL